MNSALVPTAPTQTYSFDHKGNAARLVHRWGNYFRWVMERGAWVVWDGKRWAEDLGALQMVAWMKETAVDGMAAEYPLTPENDHKGFEAHIRASGWAGVLMPSVELAKSEYGIPINEAQLDADPGILNTQNGIVDLRTGELRRHDPAALCSRITSVDYRPEALAEAVTFPAFLSSSQPDEVIRHFLQVAYGYSITGVTKEGVLLIHKGRGANGKGTLDHAVLDVLGDYAMVADASTILARGNQHTEDLARLAGARYVSTSEAGNGTGQRMNEKMVKQATGGDPIPARFMRQNTFTFLPQFTLHVYVNALPEIRGTDEGIWRRVVPVPWDRYFEAHERDLNLDDKLRAEYEAILAWLVAGAVEWYKTGLVFPDAVDNLRDKYRASSDLIARFLDDCVEAGHGDKLLAKEWLFDAFRGWAQQEGRSFRPDQNTVSIYLEDHGWEEHEGRVRMADFGGVTKRQLRCWIGKALTEEGNEFLRDFRANARPRVFSEEA